MDRQLEASCKRWHQLFSAGISSLEHTPADAAAAMADNAAEQDARIAFATPELLWQVLTAERWALLKAIAGAGQVSIEQAAARTGRDLESIRADVDALAQAGILDRVADERVEFPYDTVRVELLMRAA
ncbi:MAG: DNA-binding protein [Gammaproteobacteria bacterium]|nr:DNA-binding protein [Gammaproteobacteria bacterium]